MEKKISPFNLLILTIALGYFGWFSLENVRLKWASSNWANVSGAIVSSEIAAGRHNARYVTVEYVYKVGGSNYRNDRISFGDGVPSKFGSADDFVKQHPPGTPVTVYYDPRNPARSSLFTSGTVGGYLLLALVCWGFAIGILYSVFRSSRDRD